MISLFLDFRLFMPPLRDDDDYIPEYYFIYLFEESDLFLSAFDSYVHLNIKLLFLKSIKECESDFNKIYTKDLDSIIEKINHKLSLI